MAAVIFDCNLLEWRFPGHKSGGNLRCQTAPSKNHSCFIMGMPGRFPEKQFQYTRLLPRYQPI